ncbi:amidase family protein [Bradyrhizobium sp. 76]|uniref:amidase family protein n=1 Tax=Bradyrhizobium sp. 76 TaxID=2782680 RepID=UPI003209E06F
MAIARHSRPTVNPWNAAHSRSVSSGSAAAVTAGLVPLAVGAQTMGSIIRSVWPVDKRCG